MNVPRTLGYRYQMRHPSTHVAEVEHTYSGENPFRTLLYLFNDQKTRVAIAFTFFCIKHSPSWVIPLLTANIIDIISQHKSLTSLFVNLIVLIAITLQNWPANIVYVKFQSRAIREVENRLRSALVERMQQLSMGFYLRTNAGILQTKVVRDVENIEQMVRNLSDGGFVAINGVIGAILITTLKVPAFLPFFLILGPCSALLIIKLRRKLNTKNELFRSEIEVMSARVNEMTTLIPITRAHGLEKSALQVMYESFSNVKRAGLSLDAFNANFNAMAWVTFQMANIFCLGTASYCALEGKFGVTTGDVVLLTSFFGQLIGAVILISSLMPQIAKGFSSIRSLGEVLESPDIEANAGKPAMKEIHGIVDFKDVTFAYSGSSSPAIKHLTLRVRPGEMIAIVGPSGSGKSTLINLAIGFLRPQSGTISFDGNDLSKFDLRTARQYISVVPQESVLFDGSVRENIIYGLGDVSDQEVRGALAAANASEFVAALPDGVDTIVGERGARISGGQKQRLAIARALIRNPRILVLDEATSALDSESEHAIQKALESLMANRTTFVVAHRLSTVQKADNILVLQDGELVEQGTHLTLSKAGGVYQRLFDAQTFIKESGE
jgi:ATP-binding cassette, subfamily B, bacterial